MKKNLVKPNGYKVLKLAVYCSLYLASGAAVSTDAPKTYTRAPMNASNAIMDDPLLGNNYEKPTWNLHDAADFAGVVTIGVEQRTRYENIGDTFKPNQNTGI